MASVAIIPQFTGELKGDVGFSDASGTLGAATTHGIELTTKYANVVADRTTTGQPHYNHDVIGEEYAIPFAWADTANSDNNQRFTGFDNDGNVTVQLLYSEQITAQECLNDILKYIATSGYGLIESADGYLLIDANGDIIYQGSE